MGITLAPQIRCFAGLVKQMLCNWGADRAGSHMLLAIMYLLLQSIRGLYYLQLQIWQPLLSVLTVQWCGQYSSGLHTEQSQVSHPSGPSRLSHWGGQCVRGGHLRSQLNVSHPLMSLTTLQPGGHVETGLQTLQLHSSQPFLFIILLHIGGQYRRALHLWQSQFIQPLESTNVEQGGGQWRFFGQIEFPWQTHSSHPYLFLLKHCGGQLITGWHCLHKHSRQPFGPGTFLHDLGHEIGGHMGHSHFIQSSGGCCTSLQGTLQGRVLSEHKRGHLQEGHP